MTVSGYIFVHLSLTHFVNPFCFRILLKLTKKGLYGLKSEGKEDERQTKDKRTNNKIMHLDTKNNGAACYLCPGKIELIKGTCLLDVFFGGRGGLGLIRAIWRKRKSLK